MSEPLSGCMFGTAEHQRVPEPKAVTVMLDPEGNAFCMVADAIREASGGDG